MSDQTPDRYERWADRFERSTWLGRVAMLGGGAVRVTANAIDKTLDRTASIWVASEDAFRKEVDPNIVEARILEEREEPRRRPDGERRSP